MRLPKMSKKQENSLDKLSFEDTISVLEEIVDQIETGQTPLEQSLEQYEKGMKLIAHCKDILQKCEEKIEIISQKNASQTDGSLEDEDLF